MVLIVVAGVAIAAISFNETSTAQIASDSSQALVYAQAGALDALQKLSRNSLYTCPGSGCYTIDFVTNGCSNNTGCASISVTGNPTVITSQGRCNNSIRKVQVTVTFDSDGVITVASWQEL
jgi:hypothetical protein